MNVKIVDVEIKENFILYCKFNNGKNKIYDVKPIIKDYKNFNELEDEKLFNKVKIDSGGYGISWNENIDLAVEELWENGKEVYVTPDILQVEVLEDYLLKLIFKTKEEKIYDMKNLINSYKIYEKLKNKEYFKKVTIRGETIEWANGEDVCPEELYYNSKPIENSKKKN